MVSSISLCIRSPLNHLLREAFSCLQRTVPAESEDHEVFSIVTGGRAPSFSRLGYGGNRSPELAEGNGSGQNSPVAKSLKRPARESRNERKDFMVLTHSMSTVLCSPQEAGWVEPFDSAHGPESNRRFCETRHTTLSLLYALCAMLFALCLFTTVSNSGAF